MSCEKCRFHWDNFIPLNYDYEQHKNYGYCFVWAELQECEIWKVQGIDSKWHKMALEKRKPKNIIRIAG